MSIKPLKLKRNDLQPYYQFGVTHADGTAVDCTGATAVFTMVDADGLVVINRQTCTWTDATAGEGEYRWQAGNTGAAGTYEVEVEITPVSGGKFTLPASGRVLVVITADMDGE